MSGAPHYDMQALLRIMAQLRGEQGCNWDRAQTPASLAPYVLEEAHEVTAAIAEGDSAHLCEELGDLLLQVVFQAQIAEEQGQFDFGDVVQAISSKLVRRHPHVFAAQQGLSPEEVSAQWERIKAEEAAAKGSQQAAYWLESVPAGLPALLRAEKLQKRASRVGFDWNDPRAVLAKLREELDEVEEALIQQPEQVAAEVGDLLFAMVNLARHLQVDSEQALKLTNAKFLRRFAFIEDSLRAQGRRLQDSDLAEMDALWEQAKVQLSGACHDYPSD